jgi:hypothetical protein
MGALALIAMVTWQWDASALVDWITLLLAAAIALLPLCYRTRLWTKP